MRDKRLHRGQKPADYLRPSYGRCIGCGHLLVIDRYRNDGRENRATRCDCPGYPFRHRRGSLLCDHGKAAAAGFSFADRGTDEFLTWRESR